jgi:hypothetical protein
MLNRMPPYQGMRMMMTMHNDRRVMIVPSVVDLGAGLLESSNLSLTSCDSKETGCGGGDQHQFAYFHDVSSGPNATNRQNVVIKNFGTAAIVLTMAGANSKYDYGAYL